MIRTITGAFVGAMGGYATFLAAFLLAFSFCGWDETCTDDARRTADVLGYAGFFGGLTVTALVYAGLLKLQRQPRPWSVVVPGTVLSAVPLMIPDLRELDGAIFLPGAALAVAGLITAFGPWREILHRRPQ
ncbi:hypothetical protein [Lentzea terrae]|uniref:hypothetical protein n=1 Tax=Lentzea terrae TaxID=2200761 RepID=UPI0013001B48|nr:hypothetical protein [Lentzea terrae]